MHVWSSLGCRMKHRRPQSQRGFTRQPESPNGHISGFRLSKTPPNQREDTQRYRKRAKRWREREQKERNFGRSGGGGSGGGWSGARWSRGNPNQQQPQQHQHRQKWRVEAKPKRSVAPKGVGGEGWSQRDGQPLPRFWVWICRVWVQV